MKKESYLGICRYMCLLGLAFLLLACAKLPQAPPQTEPNLTWLNLVAEGDRAAEKRHYLGWQRAERFYAQAAEINDTPQLRQRRAMNLLLLMFRKRDLQISFAQDQELYLAIKEGQEQPIQRCVDWMIRISYFGGGSYDSEKFMKHNQEPYIDIQEFASDIELYLYHAYNSMRLDDLRVNHQKSDVLSDRFTKEFPGSPLALYMARDQSGSYARFFDWDADYVEPHFFEAQTLLSLGKKSRAEAQFKYVLERTSDIPGVHRGLGLINLAYENYAKAMEHFTQVLLVLPNDHEALFGLGAAQLYTQLYPESLATFAILVDRNLPYQGQARYYKALNLYHLQRHEEALAALKDARDYTPDSPDMWELQGIIYYYLQDLKLARESFHMAKDKREMQNNVQAVPHFYLGLIDYKQGRLAQAFAAFDRASLLDLGDLLQQATVLKNGEDGGDIDPRAEQCKRKRFARTLAEVKARFEVFEPLLKKCPSKKMRMQILSRWQEIKALENN